MNIALPFRPSHFISDKSIMAKMNLIGFNKWLKMIENFLSNLKIILMFIL